MVGGLFTIAFDVQNAASSRGNSPALRRSRPEDREYIGDVENALVRVAVEDLLSETPRYCPVTFVGSGGLGKTLLACGLAGQLRKNSGLGGEVLLYTGSDFSRAIGYAAETNHDREFRRRIIESAGLIIDDAHQLGATVRAQEELIIVIDRLVEQQRPLVLTFNRPPADTNGLLPALASRISGGLIVPLAPPGPVARAHLVRRLAKQLRLKLPESALTALVRACGAEEVSSTPARRGSTSRTALTVPQLRAALEQLPDDVDEQVAQQRVAAHWAAQQPDLRSISSAVARYFHQRIEDLHGPARRKELVQARGIAMYLARQLTDNSLGQLGKHFGNRDHTTVLHACRKTERLIENDAAVRKAVEELAAQFSP